MKPHRKAKEILEYAVKLGYSFSITQNNHYKLLHPYVVKPLFIPLAMHNGHSLENHKHLIKRALQK